MNEKELGRTKRVRSLATMTQLKDESFHCLMAISKNKRGLIIGRTNALICSPQHSFNVTRLTVFVEICDDVSVIPFGRRRFEALIIHAAFTFDASRHWTCTSDTDKFKRLFVSLYRSSCHSPANWTAKTHCNRRDAEHERARWKSSTGANVLSMTSSPWPSDPQVTASGSPNVTMADCNRIADLGTNMNASLDGCVRGTTANFTDNALLFNSYYNSSNVSPSSLLSSSSTSSPSTRSDMDKIRNICEVYLSMPIALIGIVGNMLSLMVLRSREQRRRQSQASTAIIGKTRTVIQIILCN